MLLVNEKTKANKIKQYNNVERMLKYRLLVTGLDYNQNENEREDGREKGGYWNVLTWNLIHECED